MGQFGLETGRFIRVEDTSAADFIQQGMDLSQALGEFSEVGFFAQGPQGGFVPGFPE